MTLRIGPMMQANGRGGAPGSGGRMLTRGDLGPIGPGGTNGAMRVPASIPVSPGAGMNNASMTAGAIDGSRPIFITGGLALPSELLMALPMVNVSPALGVPPTSSPTGDSELIKVTVQGVNGMPSAAAFNAGTGLTPVTPYLSSAIDLKFGRLGLAFSGLKIDEAFTAQGSAQNYWDWQLRVAAIAVLIELDLMLAQGPSPGAQNVAGFSGLATIATSFGRTTASSGDVEYDTRYAISKICPAGAGQGEGPDCLIGGTSVLRKLMATTSGQQGLSGWRHDARIGRMVYHYMGLPYYRTQTDESSTGRLYAANLGQSGLKLLHLSGTEETFGLTVDEWEQPSTGVKNAAVTGAFALMPWDSQCFYEISGINVSVGL